MGGGAAANAEALHDALETFALRDPKHVDDLALGENRDREDVAGLAGERLGEADLVEQAGRRFEAGLLGVIGFGLGGVLR